MTRSILRVVIAALVVLALGTVPAQAKKLRLKASHQFAEGDVRDQVIRNFGKKVSEKLKGEVDIRVYPAKSLYGPRAQWDAMKQGALDMSLFPLDYAAGKVPQFSITLMPCIVDSLQKAQDWRKKEIGKKIEALAEANGVKILLWVWLPGGPGSTAKQVKLPEDAKGLKMRAAGKKFEYMLKEGGASITSMPSSEIYHALATGVLNSALTSTGSFVSYRLYEQLKFINIPRDYSIWFMGEPVCMSLKSWAKLSPEQQKVFSQVAEEMNEKEIVPLMASTTQAQIEAYSKAEVEIHYMTKDEFGQWLEFAKKTAWKNFADTVEGGQELLDLALKAMD